jgi:hypothetical protein
MTMVTHEPTRTVIVDRGQTYSLAKDGTLRVLIESTRTGRIQWRRIVGKRRLRQVFQRAAIPTDATGTVPLRVTNNVSFS